LSILKCYLSLKIFGKYVKKSEELFNQILDKIPGTKKGKMFGALCIVAPNGKSGVMLWKDFMVFKLEGDDLNNALKLKGSSLFDPMGGRPMKGWVQIPMTHADKWEGLAIISMELVKKLKKK